MKPLLRSLGLLLASLSGLATAQVPIPIFTPQFLETFENTPGATTGFFGFPPLGATAPNTAFISGLPSGGIIIKSQNQAMLPPLRGQTCLFGRGCDVQIQFFDPMLKFGGFFSRTNVAGGPVAVTFQFFLGPNQVGNTVTVALPPTGGPGTSNYIGLFFDLQPVGGYDRVNIIGVGGVFPANQGFVGMDDLIASQI